MAGVHLFLRSGQAGGWRGLPKRLGGGYCRLRMPLKLALAVREAAAGHRLDALEGGYPPHFQCSNVSGHFNHCSAGSKLLLGNETKLDMK